jgi:hypothetical protein
MTFSTMSLDAIIIPSARDSSYLKYALQLAQEAGCFLIIFCSREASAVSAQELISAANVRGLAVDIPIGYSHPLLSGFATSGHADAIAHRDTDLSLKRNLGVLIARLAGWQKIFFLDDDIGSLSASALHEAAASLDQHDLAGFIAGEYPDNSVIRHAERLSGTEPGRHLSGSALAVNVAQAKGFFPDIYNEDWLFMYDNEDKAVEVGYVAQQPYDPFRSPRRAVSEEFGDVIAEGLLALNTGGLAAIAASESDWQAVLYRRRLLITDIRSRLVALPATIAQESALRSLEAAEARLLELDPASCVRYIKSWRRDLSLWHQRLDKLKPAGEMPEIMSQLGLRTVSVDFIPQNR